jgi:hypothetical protein
MITAVTGLRVKLLIKTLRTSVSTAACELAVVAGLGSQDGRQLGFERGGVFGVRHF